MAVDVGAGSAVQPPQAPRESVERGGVGGRGVGPAPGVEHGGTGGLQGDYEVGGPAARLESREHVLALRLGERGGAAIGAIARLVAAAAVVPFIGVVAVEVGAPGEWIATAVAGVGVLRPAGHL